jgi:hypothetical protein
MMSEDWEREDHCLFHCTVACRHLVNPRLRFGPDATSPVNCYSKEHLFGIIIIIIISSSSGSSSSSIQPLGQFWQEPEPSQATGMALVHCVPGKFLGVGCHYFPLPLDILTFDARCSHVPINVSAPSSERRNYRARNGRLILPITCDFHGKL